MPLHPSFAYEVAFHLLAFAVLVRYRDRLSDPADLFTVRLLAYGVFRFLVEFARGNEVVWAGLTRPQLFLAAAVPLLAWRAAVVLRGRRTQVAVSDARPSVADARPSLERGSR